ncbi:HTH-type transcriptional activator TipA [Bacillus subtilis]|nr:HTH-type transcriptional activator TipA [Bacillus cereus]CUB43944.1 HTH-type transcriptional activator TipA [Bacillus subtilis]
MSEDVRKYFTTGEFSKLCRVKKQTLFHYDDIGLFSPEIKKENGYRYYSYHQFEIFQVISLFKELGVPLKEIKRLIKDKTPDKILHVLKEKSIEIDKKKMSLSNCKRSYIQKWRLLNKHLRLIFPQFLLNI